MSAKKQIVRAEVATKESFEQGELLSAAPARIHFAGLDTLRFYAAALVVICHAPMTQTSAGLPSFAYGAIFFRGAPAVSFFFTLSGFLITFLLLDEKRRTGTVSVRAFYLRRILRIWPLYFLVIGFGLAFYNFFLPLIGIEYKVEYPLLPAIALYVLFLPNLMNSLYSVGGILNPTWSIGVEEQFYLLWAPVVKRWHARMPLVCLTVFLLSMALFSLNMINPFGLLRMQNFFAQLKFHFMAAGAFAAWMLYERPAKLFSLPFFTRRPLQWLMILLLVEYIVIGTPRHWFIEESLQVLLYSWLIVDVSVNPRRLVKVKTRITEWLGEISYGIYMYHMIALYFTSWYFNSTQWWRKSMVLYIASYYLMAVALTILISYLSYRYFEKPILRLKARFSR